MSEFSAKELTFYDEAMAKLIEGARKVYEAVTSTMGPGGRFVISETQDMIFSKVTKDGVSVARQIVLADEKENLGAQMLIQNAWQQVRETGDGTTLTTLLAYELIKEGVKSISHGVEINAFLKGIETCVVQTVLDLENNKVDCNSKEDIQKVAYISCNNDSELAKIIADTIRKVGGEGIIKATIGKQEKPYSEYTNGYQVEANIQYKEFINHPKGMFVEKPYVLVVEDPIIWTQDIVPIIEKLGEAKGKVPLVIFCPEIKGEALKVILGTARQDKFFIPLISPPGLGKEQTMCLEDVAAISNATYISSNSDIRLKDLEIEHLGMVEEILSDERKTIIKCSKEINDKKIDRINYLNKQIKTSNDEYEIDLAQKSYSKLKSGMGLIYVYGKNESEQQEILDRVDDAIHACKSAIESGVVEGGGVALLKTHDTIRPKGSKDFQYGYDLVNSIKSTPINKILENAGIESKLIIEKIKENEAEGYTIQDGYSEFSMIQLGILDPFKVVSGALQNAASIAKLILRSAVIITNSKKEDS